MNRTNDTANQAVEKSDPSLGVTETPQGDVVFEDPSEPSQNRPLNEIKPTTVTERLAESQEKTRDWVIKGLIVILGLTFVEVMALVQWGTLAGKGETLIQSIL